MNPERIKLLFIDDEPHNLDALKASYRREWEIYTAENAAEAQKIIQENDISVVLSDHLMPNKTGVELLEEFSVKYPNISRILITAHADTPLIAKAINKGKIHYFLEKPWNNETLKQAVISCHNIYLINKELLEKNNQLAKANDDLSRFIYSASHEMRSPLMSILGLIDLTKQDANCKASNEYLDLMKDSVNDVDSFIQGIVEYYKNSKIDSVYEKIVFPNLMSEIVTEYSIDPKVSINVVSTDEDFYCDSSRLKIALGNLLSNAFSIVIDSENELKIEIKTNVYEAVIEISEKNSEILYNFVENVFKFFFNTNNVVETLSSNKIMSLFLFKDALLKLNGTISLSKNNNVTSYIIKIPSKK